MTADRWQKVEAILQAALDIESSAERHSFVAKVCAGDEELRAAVERLIAADEDAASFIESPVWTDSRMLGTVVRNDLVNSFDECLPDAGGLAGKKIGVFELKRELGRGGMGAVYLAERADGEFRHTVAVKLIKRGMDTDFIVRRFRRERQILAALDHPLIARLIDGGSTPDGLPYFVMEYVEGETLYRFCDGRRLNTGARLRLFREICEGVDAAHRAGVVHRDLKPSNILVKNDFKPKLLDFGIAKIINPDLANETSEPTATAMRLMTAEYASPEQISGEQITPASDVYSLGVMLYELLTGHRPYSFRRRSSHEIHRAVCKEMPGVPSESLTREDSLVPAKGGENRGGEKTALEAVFRSRDTNLESLRRELAGDLDNIILKALRKNAAERYQTAAALAADIERYLEKRPVAAEPFAPEIKRPEIAEGATNDYKNLSAVAFVGRAETAAGESGETSGEGYKSAALAAARKTALAEAGSESSTPPALAPAKTSFLKKRGVRQGAFIMLLGFFSPLGFMSLKWLIGLPLSWSFLPVICGLIFTAGLIRLAYAALFETKR